MKIYLVGGAIRDQLLGLSISERDWVVVGATPQQLIAQGFKKVGKDFPVFLHPQTQEEYALARTERKVGKGYAGFECYAAVDVTLEQDLKRRDLRINAMAQTEKGEIVDLFEGQADLNNRLLRHVSDAFSEDPLRVLRVARFAARLAPFEFKVAKETLDLMRRMVSEGELDTLASERIWQETLRALKEKDPRPYFLVLRACGALKHLWPALDKLWGVPQPEKHHPEIDTGLHVMMVLKEACLLSDDPLVRFAALCHDLGKGETPLSEWPSHRGHEARGVPLIHHFCDRYRLPNDYRDLAILTSRFHLHCHRIFELKPQTIVKTLEGLDAFRKPTRFKQFLIACEADARGRLHAASVDYPQAARFEDAYNITKAIPVQPLIQQGFQGVQLGQQIHQARVVALNSAFL